MQCIPGACVFKCSEPDAVRLAIGSIHIGLQLLSSGQPLFKARYSVLDKSSAGAKNSCLSQETGLPRSQDAASPRTRYVSPQFDSAT